MQYVQLIHNPSAGDETHKKADLISAVEEGGFTCRYSSTKQLGWKKLHKETDLIAIAGGDGTVRKVVKQVLQNEQTGQTTALSVLPLGTANNIAKTFNLNADTKQAVQNWKEGQLKKVDIGKVENVAAVDFFLEGLGFGLFPQLMKEMKKREEHYLSPEEELQGALKTLHRLLLKYKPRRCRLEVDGTDHSGLFYMVEVMNIRSIGPNIVLAPLADPGDGELEVVLVPEVHKEKFSEYLLHKLTGGEDPYQFHTLKGKQITVRWDGCRLHVDDKMLKIEKDTEVKISVDPAALQFLIPAQKSKAVSAS